MQTDDPYVLATLSAALHVFAQSLPCGCRITMESTVDGFRARFEFDPSGVKVRDEVQPSQALASEEWWVDAPASYYSQEDFRRMLARAAAPVAQAFDDYWKQNDADKAEG